MVFLLVLVIARWVTGSLVVLCKSLSLLNTVVSLLNFGDISMNGLVQVLV